MAYGADTMRLLAETAKEHDLLIVADEIYTAYVFEPFTPMRTLPGMAERTVTFNSFSKNYLMTGWRVRHDDSGACAYKNHAEDNRPL
ncbi:MAG: aminotransferase class I/II-fold pyridoxal phosphate-dependent enzyme [Oscillospiraceae bacterium]